MHRLDTANVACSDRAAASPGGACHESCSGRHTAPSGQNGVRSPTAPPGAFMDRSYNAHADAINGQKWREVAGGPDMGGDSPGSTAATAPPPSQRPLGTQPRVKPPGQQARKHASALSPNRPRLLLRGEGILRDLSVGAGGSDQDVQAPALLAMSPWKLHHNGIGPPPAVPPHSR